MFLVSLKLQSTLLQQKPFLPRMENLRGKELLLLLSPFSRVQLYVTLWTAAHQAPLSMGFSRQEYWSALPFSPPRQVEVFLFSNPNLEYPGRAGHGGAELLGSEVGAPCGSGQVQIQRPAGRSGPASKTRTLTHTLSQKFLHPHQAKIKAKRCTFSAGWDRNKRSIVENHTCSPCTSDSSPLTLGISFLHI